MSLVSALISCAKDPLAGAYLYGFIVIVIAMAIQNGPLLIVGLLAMFSAIVAGAVLALGSL